MNKILLIFLNNLEEIDEFNKVVDKFEKNGYSMYLFDDIKNDKYFSIAILPELVNSYRNEDDIIDKIVLLSNSRDLLFSLYRCYNALVEDFIYFVDKDEKNYFNINDEHFSFYYNLYEFNSIKNENIHGKIYLSKIDNILLPIYYDSKYFDDLINYDYEKSIHKIKLNKQYNYNGYEYIFISEENQRIHNIQIKKMDKRIVFFKGQSQYDVLRVLTDYRVEFFLELGFDVDVIDLMDTNYDKQINEVIIDKKPDFVYSLSYVGSDFNLTNGRNVYDTLGIPFYGILGDHPVNNMVRIKNAPKITKFTCMDSENIKFFEKYFPERPIMMMPKTGILGKNYKETCFADRSIDILFVGTLIDPSIVKKSWMNLNPIIIEIMDEISERMIKYSITLDIDDELSKEFNKKNLGWVCNNDRFYIHSQIERYVRHHKRYELVKKLGESELEVVVIGDTSEYSKLNKSGRLIIKDKLDYQELLDLFNDCKMLVNMTGHLLNGVTERILSAMINGVVVVTERDKFAIEHFSDKEDIILYNLNKFQDTIKDIKWYLNNIQKLSEISRKGQELALREFDFRHSLLPLYRIMRDSSAYRIRSIFDRGIF